MPVNKGDIKILSHYISPLFRYELLSYDTFGLCQLLWFLLLYKANPMPVFDVRLCSDIISDIFIIDIVYAHTY